MDEFRIVTTSMKKNNVGWRATLLNFKNYYKITIKVALI